MRFLADENFPSDAVAALRTSGHDALWIRTDAPGITDQDALARSLRDARVLLTSASATREPGALSRGMIRYGTKGVLPGV